MEPFKIENDDIKRAIQNDYSYIQVGTRKFLLVEVEEASDNNCYEVTDPDEEKWLMSALNDPNPILTDEEINKTLGK